MRLYSDRSIKALKAEIEKTSPAEWAICMALVVALVVVTLGYAYLSGDLGALVTIPDMITQPARNSKPQVNMALYYQAVHDRLRRDAVQRAMSGAEQETKKGWLKSLRVGQLDSLEDAGMNIPGIIYDRAHKREVRELLQKQNAGSRGVR